MKNFDEFSKPEEYISPLDKHLRSALRNWVDKEVLPNRRKSIYGTTDLSKKYYGTKNSNKNRHFRI